MNKPNNLKEALRGELTEEEFEDLVTSFDVVGDIAVIKVPDSLLKKKEAIGEALMRVHRNVNTVLRQSTPVKGEYRTRDLEVIAGDSKTETTHTEYGCKFKVDLAEVYFSPRLSKERYRIAEQVNSGDVIINMFAGVGCYSIIIARYGEPKKVYSIDKNLVAVDYMRSNIKVNKVSGKVVPVEGDARNVIENHLRESSDRVLMPLPEFGRDFFDVALSGLRVGGGVVHFYDYGEEPDLFGPSFEFAKSSTDRDIELKGKRVVRSYAPKLYHIVLDLEIGRK